MSTVYLVTQGSADEAWEYPLEVFTTSTKAINFIRLQAIDMWEKEGLKLAGCSLYDNLDVPDDLCPDLRIVGFSGHDIAWWCIHEMDLK